MTTVTSSRRRSAIETASCLFRYNAIYNQRVQESSPFALRGIGYHAVKKRYIDRLFAKRLAADAEEAALAFPEGIALAQTPASIVPEVRSIFDREAERFELDVDAYVLSEERLAGADDVDEFTPDLVYAHGRVLTVIDDKTYFRVLTEREARNTLQARFYVRRAALRWPGFDSYRFVFRFVRYGVEVAVAFEPHELDDTEREVEAINAVIDAAHISGEWPATPGDWCGLCALRCPIADDPQVRAVRLLTREDAEAAARRSMALLAAYSHEIGALRTWCNLNGDLIVSGARFYYKPAVSWKYPAAAVVDTLRDNAIEPKFTIGKTAVKSYLESKKYAHVRNAVSQLGTAKPAASKFTVSRATVDDDPEDEAEE
jgi:hypothetical protein